MAKSNDAYRTISEVAKWLGTQSHVLRYWESKFDVIQPMKSSGGRRYYRPEDMQIVGGIRHLLHGEGMTIKAVQALVVEKGADHIRALSPELPQRATEKAAKPAPKETKPPVRSETVEAAPEAESPQRKTDNVIAFTIDPLPVKKSTPRRPKPAAAHSGQMSLFPELDPKDDATQTLTAQFTNKTPPSDDAVAEAPMLNLFDAPELEEPEPTAPAIALDLRRKDRPNSSFPATPGPLAAAFRKGAGARMAFVESNAPALRAWINAASN